MNRYRKILPELNLFFCNYIINWIPSHTLRNFYYTWLMKFTIGKNSAILMGTRFDCKGNFKIGENSVINGFCRIDTRGGVEIGAEVSISEHVIILTSDHDLQDPDFKGRNNGVCINDYAFIGTRATILPGVQMGKGSALAAGAVLTKSVPDFEIWAGVPARKIGCRRKDLRYHLSYKRLFH